MKNGLIGLIVVLLMALGVSQLLAANRWKAESKRLENRADSILLVANLQRDSINAALQETLDMQAEVDSLTAESAKLKKEDAARTRAFDERIGRQGEEIERLLVEADIDNNPQLQRIVAGFNAQILDFQAEILHITNERDREFDRAEAAVALNTEWRERFNQSERESATLRESNAEIRLALEASRKSATLFGLKIGSTMIGAVGAAVGFVVGTVIQR